MENFWDFDVWGSYNVLAILLVVLLGIYLYNRFTCEEAPQAASVSCVKQEKKKSATM